MVADYGLDVSGYQPVDRVDWTDPRIGFAIVKASEGDIIRSKSTAPHVAAIRHAQDARLADTDPSVGVLQMSLYHFFHPFVPAAAQFKNFCDVAASVNYGIGDVIPGVDVESYLTRSATGQHNNPITRAWSVVAAQVCSLLAARYGSCMVYMTKSGWLEMGSPDWVLQYDLWVPYYVMNGHMPFQKCPATPGNKDPKIFQNYVGPMWGALTGQPQNSASPVGVDQNKKYGDLRLIDAVVDT